MTDAMKPNTVNILGITYTIEYVDKPSDVDIYKRESLWGQIDYWTRSIRIYDCGRSPEDLWQTLWHEVLHGIAEALNIKSLDSQDKDKHADLDVLSLAITDVMFRNGWMND